jgi:hypothetical protein
VRRNAAHPPSAGSAVATVSHLREQTTDRDLREVLRFLAGLPLFDRAQQIITGVAVEVLADVADVDAVRAQQMAVVAGLVVVDASDEATQPRSDEGRAWYNGGY